MKKITLSFMTALAWVSFSSAQVTLSVTAPSEELIAQAIVPSGGANQAVVRGCYLVTAGELAGLITGSVISTFGFPLPFGTSATAVTGNFTVYLQNTSDVTYMKGYSFSAAVNGMTNAYMGNITVPASPNATTSIVMSLSPGFNYTGGGLYVAYDWSSSGPFDATPAYYFVNTDLSAGGAAIASPNAPASDNLNIAAYRPCFLFTSPNMASNDIAVDNAGWFGQLPWLFNNGSQKITAEIQNKSNVLNTNIAVSLNVAGQAGVFSDVQTVTGLAAGAVTTVTFAAFSSPVNSANGFTVSVISDQNNLNNQYAGTQSVTCDGTLAISPNYNISTFVNEGIGFPQGSPGIYSFKYRPAFSASLTAIQMAVPAFTQNVGATAYGVLLNGAGSVIATSNTVTLSATNFNTFTNLTYASPVAIAANTDYYFGVAIPQGGTYPVGTNYDPTIPGFYTSGLTGGTFIPVNLGFIGIYATFNFPATTISASTSKTIICKGESATLTVSAGPASYTWAAGAGNATATSVPVSPTITTIYTVQGSASGCLSNIASITQSVSLCTGLMVNGILGSEIQLSPNPALGGKSVLSGLDGKNTILIYDLLGHILVSQESGESQVGLDLSDQPNGTYLVKIVDQAGHSKTVKIVNQN